MSMRRGVVALLGVLGVCSLGPSAWATMPNLKSYKAAYPDRDAKAYSCQVCHEHPMGRKDDLNAYGQALQAFKADQGAKALTVEDYQAFDEGDLDGDGAANAAEVAVGTDALDPASMPEPEDGGAELDGEPRHDSPPQAGRPPTE